MYSIVILALFVVLSWVMLIRPQQKRVAAQRALIDSIEVGDRVATAAGIIGEITEINGDEVLIAAGPDVELLFTRFAITAKLEPADVVLDLALAEELLGQDADYVGDVDLLSDDETPNRREPNQEDR
jgi:preprotein translocase subunit YajC